MTEEQMDLIDLHGEQGNTIRDAARSYRATVAKRLKVQEKEATQKADLIELVKNADLQPVTDEDGKTVVRCKIDDTVIEYTHETKDNVKVKLDAE